MNNVSVYSWRQTTLWRLSAAVASKLVLLRALRRCCPSDATSTARCARSPARGGLSTRDPGLRHRPRDQAPAQLTQHRLILHRVTDPDQAERSQAQRVPDLTHERLIPPPRSCLEHHHPHERDHRNRRVTVGQLRRPVLLVTRDPQIADRRVTPGSSNNSSIAANLAGSGTAPAGRSASNRQACPFAGTINTESLQSGQ